MTPSRLFAAAALVLLGVSPIWAGLTIDPTADPAALTAGLVGPGIAVSGSTYLGAPAALPSSAATFSGGYSVGLGIDQGVLLSTGDATAASQRNTSSNLTTSWGGTDAGWGDPATGNLSAIANSTNTPIFDASSLTLTFTPSTSTVYLRYAIASEEYHENVGVREDPIAVYVGGQNVALVPGTTTPVGSNSVNLTSNAGYYKDNPPNTGKYPNLAYDGFTEKFTVQVSGLTAGQQTTLKVAIANGQEPSRDSAVFVSGLSSPLPAIAADSGQNNIQSFQPGNAVSVSVANKGSYFGIGSTVTGGGAGAYLGSTAVILDGDNSGPATAVQMNWRNRAEIEKHRDVILPGWANELASDVLLLQGTTRGDAYVLQMHYSPLVEEPQDEVIDAPLGRIHIGTLLNASNLATAQWTNAAWMNLRGPGLSAVSNFQGSWASFIAPNNPGWRKSLPDLLGSWGVDIEANTVWAVLDYSDSQFAVIPEPSTLTLSAIFAFILAVFGWRRWRRS